MSHTGSINKIFDVTGGGIRLIKVLLRPLEETLLASLGVFSQSNSSF